jgi:hypothetical protein
MFEGFSFTDFVVWATPYLNFTSSLAAIVAIVAALGVAYRYGRHPLSVVQVLIEHGERHPEDGDEPWAPYTNLHVWVSNRSDYPVQIKLVSIDVKFDYVLKRLDGRKYEYSTIMFGPNSIATGNGGEEVPPRGKAIKIPAFEGAGASDRPNKVYVSLDTSHGRLRLRRKAIHTEFISTVESEEIVSHSRVEIILKMHWLNIKHYLWTVSPCNRDKY